MGRESAKLSGSREKVNSIVQLTTEDEVLLRFGDSIERIEGVSLLPCLEGVAPAVPIICE